MQTIEVAVHRDHLERLSRTRPLLGLAELIWNGLDAEATEVTVTLRRSPLGAVTDVIVRDDGHGFTHEQAIEEFGRLGGSWKSTRSATRNDLRALHGAKGEGRFRAFAVGPEIVWESVAEGPDGPALTRVEGYLAQIGTFQVSDPEQITSATYTQVSIAVPQEGVGSLDGDRSEIYLATQFAVYLSTYPDVRVVYDGQTIDPASVQECFHRGPLPDLEPPAEIIIIEWLHPVDRALYLCDANGFTLQELAAGIQARGFNFTAYVLSSRLGDLGATDIAVGEMHPEVLPIVGAARTAMRAYFTERHREHRASQVQKWKDEDTYPYKGEPSTPVDEARREAFDVIAVEVAEKVPDFGGTSPEATRLSLRLLSEAMENSPAALSRILNEVLQLDVSEQEDFADLLERTTLSAMIRASRVVADRLDFCQGLEDLIFDRKTKRQLLERAQLHRILAEETWLWGEEFNLTVDDESLDAVLRAHLQLLGREELALDRVVVPEQSTGIVDLMLSRKGRDIRGQREHLVVELKRPAVKLDSDAITQIKKYAYAVVGDERFRNTSTRWTFWLVSNEMNEFAREDAQQEGRPFGLVVDKAGLQVWVKTWSQVLESARQRLEFFREQLGYTPSAMHARQYVQAKHEQYLPAAAKVNAPSA